MMERRAGRILEEFKDLVFPADYEPGAKRRVSPCSVLFTSLVVYDQTGKGGPKVGGGG